MPWQFLKGSAILALNVLLLSKSSSDLMIGEDFLLTMQYRAVLLICLLLTVPLGLVVRFASDPVPAAASDFFGSVIYEVFWIQLWGLLYPQTRLWQIAAWVCGLTCGVEVLQLWQPDWLQNLRATLPGRLVLGNAFNWSDFPAYFVGSAVGWGWMSCLQKRLASSRRGG